MEVTVPGKVMLLGDVPAGGVVGFFDQGHYVRYLRTASANSTHVAVVSLGPFCDPDFSPNVQGPTSYFWEADNAVVFEENTAIAPKLDSVRDPANHGHVSLGTIAMCKNGQICIFSRNMRGDRAWIDLTNGELVKNPKALVLYEQYVLTM
ncbi:MAG TPA: hypothetical protein VG501_08565, partial [Rhizomicrobium sp.]|nr:hypothetical protein [Rhizomicrobium sp.]